MLYLKRCERGRGLKLAKGCVLSECNGLWDYLEKSEEEPMLKEVVKEDFMVEKEGKKEYDRRTKERNETFHGKFPKSVADFAESVSWQCLASG